MEVRLHNILFLSFVGLLISCNTSGKKEKEEKVIDVSKGEELAKSYCSSCHMFSDPSLLDKNTWVNGALPAMGPKLGIHQFKGVEYPSRKGLPNTDGIYPENPIISLEDWQHIIDYYREKAPEKLPNQARESTYTPDLSIFQTRKIPSNSVSPIISLVRINEEGGFFVYDANSTQLAKMNSEGEAEMVIDIPNPITYITRSNKNYILTSIGSILPSDVWQGEINEVSFGKGSFTPLRTILKNVERPVMSKLADLNNDGIKDLVICGYGNLKGSFYWVDMKNGKRSTIKQLPGAISTTILDYDKDGDMDIFTLFAQGDEQIIYFENDGSGKFTEKRVLRFPAVHGSSSMQVADIDGDGNVDIVYTSGDNADYSVVYKPYHGVYVYKGDGKLTFKKSFFYPMNGAFKAVASDFDLDGDLDLAAISFFADYVSQPYEGFLFFEQEGDLKFKVKTFPDSYVGRWLTMDVGDIDLDGDDDIILGNFSIGPTTELPEQILATWRNGPAALILLNTSANK